MPAQLTLSFLAQRFYAEDKKIYGTAPTPTTPTLGTGTATVAPPPPQAPAKKPRRLRRFLLYLIILSTLGYGGSVYYSLVSDNFHDFFTEYVPFGEEAVGYFEEREFRRRFPEKPHPTSPRSGSPQVTISGKSGASSRVADESGNAADLGHKGRHTSAVEDNKPQPKQKSEPPPVQAKAATSAAEPPKTGPSDSKPSTPTPAKEEPKAAPAALIDHTLVKAGEESVVQDVVKILNDIITVVNADNAAGKYSAAIAKAKDELSSVVNKIALLKETGQKAAEDKIRATHTEFDEAAKALVDRLEEQMREQETHWKEEYETEREKLSQTFQAKLKSELDAAQNVYDQRLANELLGQSITLQRQFSDSVRSHVEAERNGRLSRLSELSDSVQELEKLTGEWNTVVDANLKTQHLVVAVEAVRATLEHADRPRPFTEELAALKEVADDDPVVNAAIASINPVAYQRGILTASQLVDRFRRVAAEVRKAALLPENAGVASHLASQVLSRVMFKKQGLPVGQDVESILTRTEVLLEEGDLDSAAREMNGLTGWAKVLSRDWLAECRRVLEVKQALDVSGLQTLFPITASPN